MVDVRPRDGIDDQTGRPVGTPSPSKGLGSAIVRSVDRAKGGTPQFAEAENSFGLPGFLQGFARNALNFYGDVGNFFTGKPNIKGGGPGDAIFGASPGLYAQQEANVLKGQPLEPELSAQEEIAPFQMKQGGSFLDYLAEAETLADRLGLGQAADYSGLSADANRQRDRNAAYLQAIYNQVRRELGNSVTQTGETTRGAIDRSQQIAANAQGAIGGAYDAASTAQSASAARLGLQDALASQQLEDPSQGLAAQRADAVSDTAQRGQGNQEQYNAQGANAERYYGDLSAASNFAEVEANDALNSSLTTRLAEIAAMQAEANSAAQQQRAGGLMSLLQSLQSRGDAQLDQENQLAYNEYLRKLEEQAAANQQSPLNGMTGSIAQLAELYGLDPNNIDDVERLAKLLRTTGSAYDYFQG